MIEKNDLALIMVAIFLLVGVIFRVAMRFKSVGDSGIRLSSKLESKKKVSISVLFFISFAAQGVLAWAYSKSYLKPQVNLELLGVFLGLSFSLGGIALASYSQFSMKDSWRIGVDPGEKTELITHGIYSKIRNPIYTACIIYGIGLICLAPHISLLIVGLAGLLTIVAYVKQVEEPYLINIHGEIYLQYMKQTGSYLPKLNGNCGATKNEHPQ